MGFCLNPAFGLGQQWTEIQVDETKILNQEWYTESINACAPTAMANSLRFGRPDLQDIYRGLVGNDEAAKLQFLIEQYFRGRKSVVFPAQKRWGFHGVQVEDLAASFREILAESEAPRSWGMYLDRKPGETDSKHLHRIHEEISRSIRRGFPPLLSLRSFAVKTREENSNQPQWEPCCHHVVSITAVPEELNPKAVGFPVRVIDPQGGFQTTVFLHPEPNQQPFNALKGNMVRGRWIPGRAFLTATAPEIQALRPANLKWSERFVVTANYLVSGD